uniref:Uncharacterized protein n=1 Tax=Rhizophora mucronata TaxID=61149 RepID=A0A2P2J577_RHIMU
MKLHFPGKSSLHHLLFHSYLCSKVQLHPLGLQHHGQKAQSYSKGGRCLGDKNEDNSAQKYISGHENFVSLLLIYIWQKILQDHLCSGYEL